MPRCRTGEGGEGRKDRRQEGGVPVLDQGTRKVTETLPVPPWSHKCLSTDSHIVLHQNTSSKASSTGMNCQSPRDNLPAASSQCFALAFPDVGEEGPAKYSQIVYSEKMALGAPSCSWRKQTQRLPSPRRPVASHRHANVPQQFGWN